MAVQPIPSPPKVGLLLRVVAVSLAMLVLAPAVARAQAQQQPQQPQQPQTQPAGPDGQQPGAQGDQPQGQGQPPARQGQGQGQGQGEGGQGGQGGQEGEGYFAPHPPLAIVPVDQNAQGQPQPEQQQQQQGPGMTDATNVDFTSLTPLAFDGYIIGSGGLRYRPVAVPRDRYVYGSLGTVGGVMLRGDPYGGFSYSLHFGVSATVPLGFNVFLEEASVTWAPIEWFSIKVGHMRVPFALSQVALVTTLMFPNRAPPTELFLSGSDDGALVSVVTKQDTFEGRVGVFNGASLGLLSTTTTRVAPLFSAYLFAQPLGPVPSAEVDSRHGPFRFGLGVSGMATSGQLYDPTGYHAISFKDLRANVALSVSFLGLFLQGELLRRLETDDYAGRPSTATGVYGEGTYFFPITKAFAIAPIGRLGSSTIDETFAPRKTTTLETGIAIYPRADLAQPSTLRFILEYTSERRVTEDETAYGFLSSFQLVF